MSIATDIRGYADTAVNTGRQAFDAASTQARENVADIANKAGSAVHDLRTSAEKAVNIDAITSAVEPYLAQLRQYSTTVTDKVEEVVNTARDDKRIGSLVTTAESLTGVVVTTVNERVVKPVVSLTGRGRSTRTTPRATTAASKPATRKTAPTKAASKPAGRTAARKTTARKTTTASSTDS